MSASMKLSHLLSVKADLNFYQGLEIFYSGKYENNAKKLQAQVKLEAKFEDAVDDAQDVDKECKIGGVTIKAKGEVLSDADAEAYAQRKISKYDEELSLQLAELDVDYDQLKTMYEALVTELTAEKDSLTQSTAQSCQDNHLLQS